MSSKKIRLNKLSKKKKALLLFCVIFIFVYLRYLFLNIGNLGSTGIRRPTHGCNGVTVNSKIINKLLPEINLDFNLLRKLFVFSVSDEYSGKYCIGTDLYYGE